MARGQGSSKRLLEEGVEGTAIICSVSGHDDYQPEQGGGLSNLTGAADLGFGHIRYRLVLEVRVPGRDSYEVAGRYKVPAKAEKLSRIPGHRKKVTRGLVVPVRVDQRDPSRVAIDWEQFDPRNPVKA